MREILFRGKRVDNGGWVDGYYAVKGKDTDLEKHFIVTSTFDSNTNAYPFYFTDNCVEPETVCQYTGLTDKNGRKIFEGDVLSFIQKGQNANGIVKMADGCFFAIIEGQKCWLSEGVKRYKGKVIDNVFDNPELIGE